MLEIDSSRVKSISQKGRMMKKLFSISVICLFLCVVAVVDASSKLENLKKALESRAQLRHKLDHKMANHELVQQVNLIEDVQSNIGWLINLTAGYLDQTVVKNAPPIVQTTIDTNNSTINTLTSLGKTQVDEFQLALEKQLPTLPAKVAMRIVSEIGFTTSLFTSGNIDGMMELYPDSATRPDDIKNAISLSLSTNLLLVQINQSIAQSLNKTPASNNNTIQLDLTASTAAKLENALNQLKKNK